MAGNSVSAAKTKRANAAEGKAALKLYNKLMAEKEPAIPRELLDVVESDMNGPGVLAVNRRMVLAYLSMPFKESADAIRTDRDKAITFAAIYLCTKSSVEKYRSLVEFMNAAEARLMVSLAQREDMLEILAIAETQVETHAAHAMQ